MENCDVPNEYSDYATKIVEIAKENIKQNNFNLAFEAIVVFYQHNTSKKHEKIYPLL